MGDESVKGGGDQSGGGGGGMSLEQYQVLGGGVPVQVSGPGQLPTLAPAPVGQPGLHMPGGGSVPVSQGQGVQTQPGMNMQQAMGQPQFQVIQPSYPGGGQYATIPQVATYNSQGQLVLQPAFGLQPGLPGQGQLILSGVPQPQPQPGKPGGLMASQPSTPSKPGMQYTMTSSGQLQMQPGSQPTFIMAPQPMGSPMPGQVNMPGPGQQVVPSTMAQMKGPEGKAMMTAPQPQSGQQQFLLPNGQMAYMQPGPSTQPILQNGQLIFRSQGPEGQQLMFSPGGPPPGPPQVPQPVPAVSTPLQMQSPLPQIPQMARPSNLPTAPPGKTAISRAIAPLPPSVSQAGPRLGLHQAANLPSQAQASPKSKQKMSPRGNNVGPGRPPGPKNLNTPKMMPKLPGGPEGLLGSKTGLMVSEGVAGPPTLLPQMLPAQPVSLSTTTTPAPPHSMLVSMPQMPVKPLYQMSSSIPTSTVTPIMSGHPAELDKLGLGPPTLTKEINPPMPNLGPPNISGNNIASKVLVGQTTQPLPGGELSAVQANTPKAVVKPQVLTHVIDGHVIKESSTPFPVSPSKSKFVFQIANRLKIAQYFVSLPVGRGDCI